MRQLGRTQRQLGGTTKNMLVLFSPFFSSWNWKVSGVVVVLVVVAIVVVVLFFFLFPIIVLFPSLSVGHVWPLTMCVLKLQPFQPLGLTGIANRRTGGPTG